MRAEFQVHVGTDAILHVEGEFLFVVPDPKMRLRTLRCLSFDLTSTRPSSAGVFQARYRVRRAPNFPLVILEDEARTTKNVLQIPDALLSIPVVFLTLTPQGAPRVIDVLAELVDVQTPKPFGSDLPCLPNCDPTEFLSGYLLGRMEQT